jgi:hypothetical protein
MSTLVIFSSPPERSRLCQNSSRPPKRSEFFLSWDSPACHPSAVRPPTRPLPEARAPFGPMVRPIESCSALVVSHHLDGLLRVGAAGLLRPAAGSGVRRVSRRPSHPLCGDGYEPSVPRAAVDPAKSSPRQQPCRITAVVAFLPLPSILPVRPARLPGPSKYVANKFVGVPRLGVRLAPAPEGRLSSEEGSGVRTSRQPRSPGFPKARGDRSHRGRRPRSPESRGYLPRRPKPVGNPHRPKPVRALAGGSARHRPKPVVRRSRKRAPRALPPERGACRSGHRAAGTLPERGACRSGHRDGGVRGLAGLPKQARRLRPGSRCLPKQVRGTRAGVRCLPKQASGDPRDDGLGQPKLSGSSGPVGWACRSRLRGTGRCRRGRGEPPSGIPGRGGLRSHRSGYGAGGPCPGSR